MNLSELKGVGPLTLTKLEDNNISSLTDLILFSPTYLIYEVSPDISKDKALYYVNNVKIYKVNKLKNQVIEVIFGGTINNTNYRFIIFSKEYILYSLNSPHLYLYAKYNEDKNYFVVETIFKTRPPEIKVLYNIKGLKDANLTKIIYQAFKYFKAPKERLPEEVVSKYHFLSYASYLLKKHFPKNKEDVRQVLRRQIYESFYWKSFAYNLLAIKNKKEKVAKKFSLDKVGSFIESLPFSLTIDQEEVVKTILSELKDKKRINRLVEGDVGSGKTIVAFIAAYAALLAGYQVAFLAPTILLASQHYKAAKKYNLPAFLLTSATKKDEREEILSLLASKTPLFLIGTHSLLNDTVKFNNLGLVMIDEQQRFGVIQRSILQKRYPSCDTLYFTATPIPRSLALTYYNNLDLSLIKTKPDGRGLVKTKIVSLFKLDQMFKTIKERLECNEQVFVVVPLIKSEDENSFDLDKTYNLFSKEIKANYALIHGRLKDTEKLKIIEDFNNKKIDILIATTVIEVGINIKNASVMVVMDASRYGLAQIHQLRGRVGRGSLDGYVYLVSDDVSNERLKILEEVNDGFTLAEYDLKMRGPGEFLSHNQSGFNNNISTELEKTIFPYAVKDGAEEALKTEETDQQTLTMINQIYQYEYENN